MFSKGVKAAGLVRRSPERAGIRTGEVAVTTFISTALRGWTGSLLSAALASVMAMALAGCETGSSLLAGGGQTAPETQLAGQPAPSGTAQTARLEIAPIIGAPENVSRDLQTQLASSFERNKISVAQGPSAKGEYVLRGYIVAAREQTGSKISYIWDITDQTGKRAHRITGEQLAAGGGNDPWSGVNAQTIQSIADKTAAQVATWYNGSNNVPVASSSTTGTPVAQNTPAPAAAAATQTAALAAPTASAATATTGSIESGSYHAIIPAVTGAPGDGGVSLTGAIQRELSKNGVPLATAATADTYKVEGKVAMGQGKDGKQPIQIDWNVFDPKGKKLGTVSQKNEIPQGSLDGTWGKTADAAAQAAAQGIIKLLPPKTN